MNEEKLSMNQTYKELLELKRLLQPSTEFMCHLADDHLLYCAQVAIQTKVASYNANTSCLINIYQDTLLTYSIVYTADNGYQEFRRQWLDQLIEEYA